MNQVSANTRASSAIPVGDDTLILLCGALSELGNGLDLADIERSLCEDSPDVRVEIVADLCGTPKAIAQAAGDGIGHVVLGLCSSDGDGSEFHYQARQAGIDPLGLPTVSLGGLCALAHARPIATNKAKVLLAAAVAKARAFPGSGPEHVKPHLGWANGRVSRRALFTLPPITYEPVASVRVDRCVSEAGCDLCTAVCPRDALAIVKGRIDVDKSACDGCGLCVTECPRDAIELPTAFLGQFEEELRTLLSAPGLPPSERRAILFVCDRNVQVLEELAKKRLPYPAGWLPLRVPCTGMIFPGWVLQSLVMGASAVGVMTCSSECSFRQAKRTVAMGAYCHELLDRLGGPRGALQVLRPSSLDDLAEALNGPLECDLVGDSLLPERACLREPSATANALVHLREASGGSMQLAFEHSGSPLGAVRIDTDGCTGCESCARACPTDALTSEQGSDGLALTFDPNLCTGCGLCVKWCPEDVIEVTKVTDLGALSSGRTTLYTDGQARCERCNVAFAPAAMVRRVEQLLDDAGGSRPAIRRCPSCRGLAIGSELGGK